MVSQWFKKPPFDLERALGVKLPFAKAMRDGKHVLQAFETGGM
jgi:hypothetical protein